jgi:hypothetical protein
MLSMNTPEKRQALTTSDYRLNYQREYRRAFAKRGGLRVDLYVDGRLNAILSKSLAEYGYNTHPGHAIARFLTDQYPE